MNAAKEAPFDGLAADGDTVDVGSGRLLRLRIESDPDTDVNDFDCYGKVAWVESNRWTGRDAPRPDGFTGRARKLFACGGEQFWWEPCEGMDEEAIDKEASWMSDLVSFGFHGAIVELCDGTDFYGRPIVVDSTSLWGLDTLDGPGFTEVVSELASELLGRQS